MRFFIKFFFCFILMFCLGLKSSADSVEIIDKTEVNTIKEYKEYFDDYAKRLYENYKPEKKHFFFVQGNFFYLFINRDGTIEHLNTVLKENRFSRYVKKVILETPAYPFPEQIKDDKIFVHISIHYWSENEYYVILQGRNNLYRSIHWKQHYNKPTINIVDISIEKDCLKHSKDE